MHHHVMFFKILLFHLLLLTSISSGSRNKVDLTCCSGKFKDILQDALVLNSFDSEILADESGGYIGGAHSNHNGHNSHIDRGRVNKFEDFGDDQHEDHMMSHENQNKENKRGRNNEIMPKYLKSQSAIDFPRLKRGEVSVRKLAELLHTLKTMEQNENGLPPLQSLRFG